MRRTDAERQKYREDLPGLQKTRVLVRRQLKQAKERRRRKEFDRQRNSSPRRSAQMPSSKVPPRRASGYDNNDSARQHVPENCASDDGHGSAWEYDDDDESLVYKNLDELQRDFEAWKKEEEERKTIEEAEKLAIREVAVTSWKRQQLHEMEILLQKTEDERSSLRTELTRQRIAPQQIEEIVDHVHPRAQLNNDLRLLIPNSASGRASSVAFGNGPAEGKSHRRWSFWTKT